MKQKGGNGIGVVVAAYNAAAWLVRCLDSVLATADVDAADVCIVVADDGSTDGTAAIAQRYAETDGRVQLLKLIHGGQAAARAAAIAALPAQVDRVMIVDADDTIPRQSLSQMAARFSPDIDMVIANVAKYTAEANVPALYMDAEAVAEGIADYYKDGAAVSVHALNEPLPENGLYSNAMAGTDRMELYLTVNAAGDQMMLVSLFDNLGKGSSGAAVQCMNLMLGLEETKGLE